MNTEPELIKSDIKGYLCYKTITLQSVLSEAQIKIFFFCGEVMFRSQDIQIFVVLAILQFSKSVTL